jgi:hypothetical protein
MREKIKAMQQAAAALGEELLGAPVPIMAGSFNGRIADPESADEGTTASPASILAGGPGGQNGL